MAVSKLVSEANALNRRNQVRRTFRLALVLFLTLGLISFLVMFFRADALAGMMNDSKAAAGIRALAPAVVCVGCLAALRGYSQGHSNMAPTSVSQIIEALCKLVVGLGLAFWLVKQGKDPDVAAAGAITGVTVGTVVALIYMVLDFFLSRGREDTHGTGPPRQRREHPGQYPEDRRAHHPQLVHGGHRHRHRLLPGAGPAAKRPEPDGEGQPDPVRQLLRRPEYL